MSDASDLATIRAAAEAPAATPLVARLQAMLREVLALLPAEGGDAGGAVQEFTRQHAIEFWQTYNRLALHKVGVAQLDALDTDCTIQALQKAVER